MSETKPFTISKDLVKHAYQLIKSNQGSAGIDQQSLDKFEVNLRDNLYKIWNRMSAGSYFPPPVKAVSIPKKTGGMRILGIPMVSSYCTSYNTILGFHSNFGYFCRMIN